MQFLKANDLTGAYLSETGFKANLKLFYSVDKKLKDIKRFDRGEDTFMYYGFTEKNIS